MIVYQRYCCVCMSIFVFNMFIISQYVYVFNTYLHIICAIHPTPKGVGFSHISCKFFNVGKYCCSFNDVAETVLNSPFNTAFTMEAFQSAGTPQYIAQKAIEFESGHCKWRMRDMLSGTIMQDWVQLY